MIGLSHHILNLRLSHDQLHRLCLKIAKFLLAEFHEDRCGTDQKTKDASLRFSEALDRLKDPEVFKIYLKLFKASRSEEKSEANEWKRAYRAIKEQFDAKEREIIRLKEAHNMKSSPGCGKSRDR